MRLIARFCLLVVIGSSVVLLPAIAVACLGGPSWLGGDLGSLIRSLLAQREISDAASRRIDALQSLQRGKYQATEDLIAGRLSLEQAMERFRDLSGYMDDGQDDVLGAYPGVDDTSEAVYANVRAWVDMAMLKNPQQAQDVSQRLDREWEQLRLRGWRLL